MKRGAPWEEAYTISSDDSSDSDSDSDGPLSKKKDSTKNGGSRSSQGLMSEEINPRKKKGGINYEALSKHGYHGGPSILRVPPPRVEEKDQDWSWSKGKHEAIEEAKDESYEERERTRAASQGEKLLDVQTNSHGGKKEKSASFTQKEKRKRDIGQASRGKNYVEEEKRQLRESGIYSGFDS